MNYVNDTDANNVVAELVKNRIRGSRSIEEYLRTRQIPIENWPLILAKMTENYELFSFFITRTIDGHLDLLVTNQNDFLTLLDHLAVRGEELEPRHLSFLHSLPRVKNL